jgi:hypothetical protein
MTASRESDDPSAAADSAEGKAASAADARPKRTKKRREYPRLSILFPQRIMGSS